MRYTISPSMFFVAWMGAVALLLPAEAGLEGSMALLTVSLATIALMAEAGFAEGRPEDPKPSLNAGLQGAVLIAFFLRLAAHLAMRWGLLT